MVEQSIVRVNAFFPRLLRTSVGEVALALAPRGHRHSHLFAQLDRDGLVTRHFTNDTESSRLVKLEESIIRELTS
jgi:hypothetical protein